MELWKTAVSESIEIGEGGRRGGEEAGSSKNGVLHQPLLLVDDSVSGLLLFRLLPLPRDPASVLCPVLVQVCSGPSGFLLPMSPLMQYCSFSIHLSKAQIKVLHDFRCCTSSDVDIVYFYLFLTLAHQVTRTFIVNFFYILSNLIIYLEHTSSNVLKNN